MSLAELIPLVLKASILIIVFSLGLNARPADLTYFLRHPGRLVRTLLAMLVAMPVIAVLLVRGFGLPHTIAVMLIALSLSPVPPVLPRKQAKAGGDASYAIGLLAAVGLASIVWIPLALEIVERVFSIPLGIPPARVATMVGITILLPLAAGVIVAQLAPGLAERFAPHLARLGGLLLAIAALAILVSQWRAVFGLLPGGAPAFAIFVALGLLVGHLLGGPDPDDRTVLALATASRHPGVALAIVHINFPDEKAVIAAVLLFLLVNALLSIPYVAWRKRAGATADLDFSRPRSKT
ncbi:MAG: hypothetical protein KBC34_04425 [Phenylobacterium sp.]|nr:hypothetical protein [Phenylobacterium sp.]